MKMGFFKFLPLTFKCCFCINLKTGSTIIGFLAMIQCVGAIMSLYESCLSGILKDIVEIMLYMTIGLQVMILLISILFLLGILLNKPTFLSVFMWSLFSTLVLITKFVGIAIVLYLSEDACPVPILAILSLLLGLIIWLYFLAVVNTFKEEMECCMD